MAVEERQQLTSDQAAHFHVNNPSEVAELVAQLLLVDVQRQVANIDRLGVHLRTDGAHVGDVHGTVGVLQGVDVVFIVAKRL